MLLFSVFCLSSSLLFFLSPHSLSSVVNGDAAISAAATDGGGGDENEDQIGRAEERKDKGWRDKIDLSVALC